MTMDISRYSEAQKYDFLQQLVKDAQTHFGNAANRQFDFATDSGHINLIALRGFKQGKPCPSSNQEFDDTLFVVRQIDGVKEVSEFKLSTEFGNVGTGLLLPGQHSYYLNYHKKEEPHQSLATSATYPRGKQYRALNPHGSGVSILRDTNRDFAKSANEQLERSLTHNIHYGGENSNPQSWSKGCQVIQGWNNYKHFIELVESDTSIFGTASNELSTKNTKGDGTRPVIYTLLHTELPAQQALITQADKSSKAIWMAPLRQQNIQQLFRHHLAGQFGHYLIGANRHWHGGIHFTRRKPVQAIADGEILAYRLATANNHHFYQRNGQSRSNTYANSFVLIKHQLPLPNNQHWQYYSLYMHLQPANAYQTQANNPLPPFLLTQANASKKAVIDTQEDQAKGLNLRDIKTGQVKMIAPLGSRVALDNTQYNAQEAIAFKRKQQNNAHYRTVKFTDHNGDQHHGLYALLDASRATPVAEQFVITTQEDTAKGQQASALKGLNLRSQQNYHHDSIVKVIAKGTEIEVMLVGSQWAKVTRIDGDTLEQDAYISYVNKVILQDTAVASNLTDKVICPQTPLKVAAGDLLGYPSDNLLQHNCLHFEIFSDDSIKQLFNASFAKPLQNLYHIKPSDTLYKRVLQAVPEPTACLPQFARVEITPPESGKAYARITLHDYAAVVKRTDLNTYDTTSHSYQGIGNNSELYPFFNGQDVSNAPLKFIGYSSQGDKIVPGSRQAAFRIVTIKPAESHPRTFWIENDKLNNDTLVTLPNKGQFLNLGLPRLHSQDPEQYCFEQTSEVTLTQPAYVTIATSEIYTDANHSKWLKCALPTKGTQTWLAPLQQVIGSEQSLTQVWLAADSLSTTSSLNLPGFELVEQQQDLPYLDFDNLPSQGPFKALLDTFDQSQDQVINQQELHQAMANPMHAEKLSRLIAKHPTEWHYSEQKWQHLKALIADENHLTQAKKQIQTLSWWDQLPPETLPNAEAVYHIHPLAFLTMLSLVPSFDTIDPARFLHHYQQEFGSVNEISVSNINSLVAAINDYYATKQKTPNRYHLAYMLATGRKEAYHFPTMAYFSQRPEVGQTSYFNKYDPVLGASESLRQRATRNGNTQQGDGYKYRGRGMVHLTWRNNYQSASDALGVDFVNQPDKAGHHSHAVAIMVWGMEQGKFTGKKLADYINANKVDYTNARRIINGTNCASEIAADAKKFESILAESSLATKEWT